MSFKRFKLSLLSSTLALISLINIGCTTNTKSKKKETANKVNQVLNLVEENSNISFSDDFWYKDTPVYKEFISGKDIIYTKYEVNNSKLENEKKAIGNKLVTTSTGGNNNYLALYNNNNLVKAILAYSNKLLP